jgi:hypothetical protein
MTAGTKSYDRYVGGAQWRFLYGTKYTVSYAIKGLASKTLTKTYYKYAVETPTNGSTNSMVYTPIPTFWDVRAPLVNVSSQDTTIVDKELISTKVNTSTLQEDVTLKYYRNNGTCETNKVEKFNYKYKWIYIDASAVFTPNGVGTTEAERKATTVTAQECYQWTDGSIHVKSAATYSIGTLEADWGISTTYTITNGSNGTNYTKTYSLKFSGPSLTNKTRYNSLSSSRTLTNTVDILYASNATTVGTAKTQAAYWSSPTGVGNK